MKLQSISGESICNESTFSLPHEVVEFHYHTFVTLRLSVSLSLSISLFDESEQLTSGGTGGKFYTHQTPVGQDCSDRWRAQW